MAESGRILGIKNIEAFKRFVEERNSAGDWAGYVKPGRNKLARKALCEACHFGRSVLKQNPVIRGSLQTLEDELVCRGVLSGGGAKDVGIDLDKAVFIENYLSTVAAFKVDIEVVRAWLDGIEGYLEQYE